MTTPEQNDIQYTPTELEINDVLYQVPEDVSRDTIIETLIKTNGDVTEAVLTILTNDNVVSKQTSPKRIYPKEEIKQWTNLYNEFDKYNIEKNIERVKDASK